MQSGQIRIFISGELVRVAESKAAKGRTLVGRPMMHSTCLILGMVAVKEFLGIGYRETRKAFAERGFSKLPDFRTISWRAGELKHHNVGIEINIKNNTNGHSIIVRLLRTGPLVDKKELNVRQWSNLMHSLKTDFVELQL